jgi:hypothetical protein
MEHAPSQHPWLVALELSGLGAAMRQSEVLYPGAEILHILGFVLMVGSIIGFDLRILGLNRRLPAPVFARHNVPLAMAGFLVAAPTGFMLFATEATSIAVNTAFQVKLACIALGLLNALAFHLGPWRDLDRWGNTVTAPVLARVGAVISLLAWVGAIIGGRLIAYL